MNQSRYRKRVSRREREGNIARAASRAGLDLILLRPCARLPTAHMSLRSRTTRCGRPIAFRCVLLVSTLDNDSATIDVAPECRCRIIANQMTHSCKQTSAEQKYPLGRTCVHDLTTIRRKPVSPISAVPQGKLWIKRKYRFGFVGIKAGCQPIHFTLIAMAMVGAAIARA